VPRHSGEILSGLAPNWRYCMAMLLG